MFGALLITLTGNGPKFFHTHTPSFQGSPRPTSLINWLLHVRLGEKPALSGLEAIDFPSRLRVVQCVDNVCVVSALIMKRPSVLIVVCMALYGRDPSTVRRVGDHLKSRDEVAAAVSLSQEVVCGPSREADCGQHAKSDADNSADAEARAAVRAARGREDDVARRGREEAKGSVVLGGRAQAEVEEAALHVAAQGLGDIVVA